MNYANDHIRNVLVAGHGGAGKTSLVEAMPPRLSAVFQEAGLV